MTVGKVKDFDFKSGGMAKGYAKGGKVMPQGMIKNRGTLGVMGNKNPGETKMKTAPNLPGEKMMMNKGGKAMMGGGSMHMMPDGKMMPDSKMMKKGGMASGGMPMVMKDGKKVPAFAADGEGKMKKGGMVKKC